MELSDLIVLRFASNNCYVSVCKIDELNDPNLEVNLDKETWTYSGKTFKIGSGRGYFETGQRSGVIGVYDQSNLKHLDSAVHSATEAVRRYNYYDDL